MKKSVESAVLDNDSLVAALNSDFSEAVQVPLDVSYEFTHLVYLGRIYAATS